MRTMLRAGMSCDESFAVLDTLAMDRGLAMRLLTADDKVIGLPVGEGGELLCFLPNDVLTYVEYEGGVFLKLTPQNLPSSALHQTGPLSR